MSKKLISLLFLSFSFISAHSQEIVVIEEDTLVTITPEQVGKINKTYEELKWTKEELVIRDSIIVNDQVLIELNQKLAGEKIKNTRRKTAKIFGIIGVIVGFILGGFTL